MNRQERRRRQLAKQIAAVPEIDELSAAVRPFLRGTSTADYAAAVDQAIAAGAITDEQRVRWAPAMRRVLPAARELYWEGSS